MLIIKKKKLEWIKKQITMEMSQCGCDQTKIKKKIHGISLECSLS